MAIGGATSRWSLIGASTPKVLDLNAVILEIDKMLRRLIGEDVHLATVLSPTIARVFVDPGQIDQVVMNLAVNARDAMPQGGADCKGAHDTG